MLKTRAITLFPNPPGELLKPFTTTNNALQQDYSLQYEYYASCLWMDYLARNYAATLKYLLPYGLYNFLTYSFVSLAINSLCASKAITGRLFKGKNFASTASSPACSLPPIAFILKPMLRTLS